MNEMQFLTQIIGNKTNYEVNKKRKVKAKEVVVFSSPKRRRKLISYKLGGFWFCLTRKMWADYTGINYNTICGRDKAHKPNGVILGYEELVVEKSPGRPKK